MSLILKLFGIGVLLAVLQEVLNVTGQKSWGQLLTMGGLIIGLGIVASELSKFVNTIVTMFNIM